MYIAILAWDLKESDVTFSELRHWVATKAAADYSKLPGVRIKTWFSNEQKRIWGAVYIVNSIEDIAPHKLPRLPNGKTGPVGTQPTSFAWFDVEACVIGPEDPMGMIDRGLVYREARPGADRTDDTDETGVDAGGAG